MKIIKLSLWLIVLTSLISCNEITEVTQRSSTGGLNEILIVTNNVSQWDGEIGDSIRRNFTRELKLLPVPEQEFKVVNINEASISKKIFKKHHNIFIVNIDPSIKEAFVESKKDLWAAPQIVVKINAPNIHEWLISFEEVKENSFDLFVDNERTRIMNSYGSKFKNLKISKELKKYFHIDMNIPKGYSVTKVDSTKLWVRKETAANSMNIIVYTQPYHSTADFDHRSILLRRNNLTRTYIPGPTVGSYQVISDEYIEPISKELSYNNMFAVEMRGLWRVENDFMGGPFISYTFVDEKRGKLITIDGFAYAPKQKKAPLMRELEGMLWSLKLVD
ncbi:MULTISPECIES: DUF4837 family protein [unclassified Lentimicrobium]|uniref:DUF4837 family protein n=1 Tax=unclassified Lentimicrobium TaxID=2677434 RepID=UPI001553A50E|nr:MULTISPECIES: DUF4837 family protein [unclassified Lentimicrobium]NPD47443.1 DUF4837 family protein [Lentimicrobium sp. S6]NPD86335.1 DUF4837 family protein [Lentimicrobium sp. L6]